MCIVTYDQLSNMSIQSFNTLDLDSYLYPCSLDMFVSPPPPPPIIIAPDTENARAGENKPVIIVGGALGGFLGLLIAAAVLMTMIAVYLGCQLRLVHKKSPVNGMENNLFW